jgi:hypothetical protein
MKMRALKSKQTVIKMRSGTIRHSASKNSPLAKMLKGMPARLRAREKERAAKAVALAAKPAPDLRPRPYLVAFIDILGFGRELENAGTEADLKRAYAKVRKVQQEFQFAGAADDPKNQLQNNTDYGRRVIALSDSIVVAITPNCPMRDVMGGYDVMGLALFELIVAQARCACQGIFVRGGISHGPFFFEDDILLSPALARAYDLDANFAEYPVIAVSESTQQAVLNVPKMGSYATDADPVPPYFLKHGRRKWRGEQLYYLDYVGVMLQEDHRGWEPEDLKKYLAARKKRDDERAQELLNIRAQKDAAYFLSWHRRRLEEAYRATNSERVRKKYRWLMKYHNRSFRHEIKYIRDEVIDVTKFSSAKVPTKS